MEQEGKSQAFETLDQEWGTNSLKAACDLLNHQK